MTKYSNLWAYTDHSHSIHRKFIWAYAFRELEFIMERNDDSRQQSWMAGTAGCSQVKLWTANKNIKQGSSLLTWIPASRAIRLYLIPPRSTPITICWGLSMQESETIALWTSHSNHHSYYFIERSHKSLTFGIVLENKNRSQQQNSWKCRISMAIWGGQVRCEGTEYYR